MITTIIAAALSLAIKVDAANPTGVIKPVNGVGQPPLQGLDGYRLFKHLKAAGIPYSRLHDVGGAFGSNVFVDIPNLFRDFDKDEYEPANYDFYYTDGLMKALVENGVEPYFRLGVTIENSAGRGGKAYRIFPPKDYAKWARICEHVIRHYTEGWANGYHMKISHWEIWNEPENFETIAKNQMWKAPFEEYIKLYLVASKHLKAKFPHLMIGGYASCGFYGVGSAWASPENARIKFLMKSFEDFLEAVRCENAPLDFFSFHCYDRPKYLAKQIEHCRTMLDKYGFRNTEMSLNEWIPCGGAPVAGETGSMKQAAEIAAMLCIMQNGAVDDAEIYDAKARGGLYAPFFEPDTCRLRKAYYVYLAFNELRKLGKAMRVEMQNSDDVYVTGAMGDGKQALLMANVSKENIPLDIEGMKVERAKIIDATRDFIEIPFDGTIPAETVLLLTL